MFLFMHRIQNHLHLLLIPKKFNLEISSRFHNSMSDLMQDRLKAFYESIAKFPKRLTVQLKGSQGFNQR